jgi:cytochrome c biogenesis factor
MLLANNVLLVVAAAAVLLGTLYPLVIDALGMGKLSVGPPYFDAVFVPLMAPALFLMGVGRWRAGARPAWRSGVAAALGHRREPGQRRAGLLQRWAAGRPWSASAWLLAAWIASTAVLNLVARNCANTRPRLSGGASSAQPGSYLRHVAGAFRCRGVHRRCHGGQRLRDRVRRAHGGRRHRTVAGYTFRLDSVTRGCAAPTTRPRAPGQRAMQRRQVLVATLCPSGASTRCVACR